MNLPTLALLTAAIDSGRSRMNSNPASPMLLWTDAPTRDAARAHIERLIVSLLDERADASSICPSEVARALDPDGWRALMPPIRTIAADLAKAGIVNITQGDVVISPYDGWRGPVRLRRGASWNERP